MWTRAVLVLGAAAALVGAGFGVVHAGPGRTTQLGSSPAFDAALDRPCPAPRDIPLLTDLIPLSIITMAELPGATAFDAGGGVSVVGTRDGRVLRVEPDGVLRPFVDLSATTLVDSDRGLLGVVVTPDGRAVLVLRSDATGATTLTHHRVDDPSAARILLTVEQPDPRHNGGGLAFDRHGRLHVGIGDGGGQGDPAGAASDPSTVLGTILRFEPGLPDGGAPQVWATGVRNPFRLWFDRAGDLWVADVGERCVEEVTRIDADATAPDLGWSAYEGSSIFDPSRAAGRSPIHPVAEWSHADGSCAVIGGTEHAGDIAALDGTQIVAELCTGRLFAVTEDGYAQIPVRAEAPVDVDIGPDGQLWITDLVVGLLRVTATATGPAATG